MQIEIDIPLTEEKLKQEIIEQIKEFKKNGLLPITDDDSNESENDE